MPKSTITHWPKSAKPELCPQVAATPVPVLINRERREPGPTQASAPFINRKRRESGSASSSDPINRERGESGPSRPIPTPFLPQHPLDPYYAANPRLWVTTFLHFQPDPQQASLLDAHHPYLLLNCTRQWGKTTVIAAKALHFALFHPHTTTLVAAPSERQPSTLLRRLKSFLETLGLAPRPIPSMPLSIRLPNGSEIIALPASADTIRGFTAHLLIFDEAARVPDSLYHALSPSRATTNAPLWLLSTPKGPTGFFYEAWHEPEPAPGQPDQRCWQRFSVPATDCPRITPEFITVERIMLGDARFRQEYLCEFTNPEGCFFTRELIESAIDPTVEPLFRSPLWNNQ